MTLNFSPCALYPINSTEGDFASSIWMGNRYTGEMEDSYLFLGRDRCDHVGDGSYEPIADDILDLLPTDPFGMDLSTTFTAIAAWLEDFKVDSGLDLMWNTAAAVGSWRQYGNPADVESPYSEWRLYSCDSLETGGRSSDCDFESAWDVEEILCFDEGDAAHAPSQQPVGPEELVQDIPDVAGGLPHDGLLFSLSYLGIQDLLSAEMVCRSFRQAIRDDPLIWRNIHLCQPLSERIKDNDLLKLTDRAQGNLNSLSLVECLWITDDCLRQVLQNNPGLTKLSVPGCQKLSIRGLVNSLKLFNSTGMLGIKCLRIGDVYGITQELFEELSFLLKADQESNTVVHKPRFFHIGYSYLSNDDERPIDIETCPICQNLMLVYDCPLQSCQDKQNAGEQCRACSLCIARCGNCGRCVKDSEYEEMFSLDLLCWSCLSQQPYYP